MGISGTDWAATPSRGTKTDRQDKQDNQDKQENRDNQNNDKKATQRPTTIVDICSVALGRNFLPFVICALLAAHCRGGHEQATLHTMTPKQTHTHTHTNTRHRQSQRQMVGQPTIYHLWGALHKDRCNANSKQMNKPQDTEGAATTTKGQNTTRTQHHTDKEPQQQNNDTETQGHKDTETQRPRTTRGQRHRDTETRTKTKRHSSKGTKRTQELFIRGGRLENCATFKKAIQQAGLATKAQRHKETETQGHRSTEAHRQTNTKPKPTRDNTKRNTDTDNQAKDKDKDTQT